MTITFFIDELAPGLNVMLRQHYRVRKEIQERWILMMKSERNKFDVGFPIMSPVHVWIHRYYAGLPLDVDNHYASAKIPLDALVRSGFLPDDNNACVSGLKCEQFKTAHKKDQKTKIHLTWEIAVQPLKSAPPSK